nr:MAG TPA: hypothetical protein [Caudoviricetes sp.]
MAPLWSHFCFTRGFSKHFQDDSFLFLQKSMYRTNFLGCLLRIR